MSSHRETARRRLRTAQLAFGVGVAATVAVVTLPLQGALTREIEVADPDGTERPPVQPDPAPPTLDPGWVSSIFAPIGPDPLPPTPNPVEPDKPDQIVQGPDDVPPDEPVETSTRWQYLGSISSSRGRAALLRDIQDNNRQHLVAEGKEVDGFKVEEVGAEHVILTSTSGRQQVDRAEATGGWTTPKISPAAAAARVGQPARPNPRTMSAADRARVVRGKRDTDPNLERELRERILQGDMDVEYLSELRATGEIDDSTAERLIRMAKSTQDMSEEEYAELREKFQN